MHAKADYEYDIMFDGMTIRSTIIKWQRGF